MSFGRGDALAVAFAVGSADRVGFAALTVELADALGAGSLGSSSSGVASMSTAGRHGGTGRVSVGCGRADQAGRIGGRLDLPYQ